MPVLATRSHGTGPDCKDFVRLPDYVRSPRPGRPTTRAETGDKPRTHETGESPPLTLRVRDGPEIGNVLVCRSGSGVDRCRVPGATRTCFRHRKKEPPASRPETTPQVFNRFKSSCKRDPLS